MESMDMDSASISIGSEGEGSLCASISAGRPSQQISSESGWPLAGMKPGGMRPRDRNATSMMLAMTVRLFDLPRLKRISRAYSWRGKY